MKIYLLPSSKYKDKLQPSYKGLIHEVFTMVLRGLSGTKLTRPGKFRSCQDGYAVKSSLKAEDGVLYPLEKSFFFLPKPPTLIIYTVGGESRNRLQHFQPFDHPAQAILTGISPYIFFFVKS